MDEVGDGDEVNAPYQDQFPLFQPVCTFPMTQMMAHNSQNEWQSPSYKHNNDFDGTEYGQNGVKMGKSGNGNEVDARYQDQFCLFQAVGDLPRNQLKALINASESQGHPYTHTNHHHDMLSATQVKHEGGRKQAKPHEQQEGVSKDA